VSPLSSPLQKEGLEFSMSIQRLGEILQLMIDLNKNISEMKQLVRDFKQTVSQTRQCFSSMIESEALFQNKLDDSKKRSHQQEHQEIEEKFDLLILLIESNQLALANYHFKDLQKIWCLHRCFKDVSDYVGEKV
jgi:hypothetical protein